MRVRPLSVLAQTLLPLFASALTMLCDMPSSVVMCLTVPSWGSYTHSPLRLPIHSLSWLQTSIDDTYSPLSCAVFSFSRNCPLEQS